MSELADFLRQKKAELEKQEVEWQTVLREWLAILETFFSRIECWLAEESREGLIQIERGRITLCEEHLGSYGAPLVKIGALGEVICLKPVGRLIIGAQGRVDMSSSRGKEVFLYLSPDKGWVHLEEGERKPNLVPLTKQCFIGLLKGLLA